MSFSGTAWADGEIWSSFELRLPLGQADGFWQRASFRTVSEARFRGRSGGLGQMLVRAGLRFDLADWFHIVAQPALYLDKGEAGEFLQGVRAELEPTFSFELGSLRVSDRNRLAYRWQTDEITWYARSMLRVEYDAGRFSPFVWAEPFLDVSSLVIDEYRIMAGVVVETSGSTEIDIGYMFRSREDDVAWTQDHIAAVFVVFDGWE